MRQKRKKETRKKINQVCRIVIHKASQILLWFKVQKINNKPPHQSCSMEDWKRDQISCLLGLTKINTTLNAMIQFLKYWSMNMHYCLRIFFHVQYTVKPRKKPMDFFSFQDPQMGFFSRWLPFEITFGNSRGGGASFRDECCKY